MNLNERLHAFIKHKGLTVQQFERTAGLSNGAVNKMSENTRRATLDKISNVHPDLNIAWLLTGEGEMLKNETPSPPTENNIAALCKILERAFVAIDKRDTQIDRLISVIENSRTKQ